MLFYDRKDAGKRLGLGLGQYAESDAVVLALPRGGVAIGYEVARALGAELDVLGVKKLRAPGHPELAIGAVTGSGSAEVVFNREVVESLSRLRNANADAGHR